MKVELLVYEGKIKIMMPTEVDKNAKSGKRPIEGMLSYQGCTATLCLPPKKQRFSLEVKVLDTAT
ncbi:hypothetical protein HYW54_02980 [Candidatus Gottesmanbacteria bacterium]|nr:hypothetical protein [Candidatus Gottesmanbacteria bacterium]